MEVREPHNSVSLHEKLIVAGVSCQNLQQLVAQASSPYLQSTHADPFNSCSRVISGQQENQNQSQRDPLSQWGPFKIQRLRHAKEVSWAYREDIASLIFRLRHLNQLAGRHHIWVIQPQVCQSALHMNMPFSAHSQTGRARDNMPAEHAA